MGCRRGVPAGVATASGAEQQWAASPIQTSTSPCLIGGEPLALDEFDLQILQVRVIELKLPLERPIRQAAPLAQEGDHLIHDRDKVHPVSSLPGARPPCACATPS